MSPKVPPIQTVKQPYPSDQLDENGHLKEPISSSNLLVDPVVLADLRAEAGGLPPALLLPTTAYVKAKVGVIAQRLEETERTNEVVDKRVTDTERVTEDLMVKLKGLGGLIVAAVAVTASVLYGLDGRAQTMADKVAQASIDRDAKQDEAIKALQVESQRKALSDVRVVIMLEQLTVKSKLDVPPVILPDGGR